MLFSSSLLAIVGSGEIPSLSPRTLVLYNTKRNSPICELHFPTAILSVQLNRKRFIAVLHSHVHVCDMTSSQTVAVIETQPNPRGLCCLSASQENCYLAFPESTTTGGNVCIYDALTQTTLNVIEAHTTPLQIMQFNAAASLLATASTKGTPPLPSLFYAAAIIYLLLLLLL